ncbi:MAG: VapE domain-containing protein [Cyanobacteria bacterium P01_A01_bin.114]
MLAQTTRQEQSASTKVVGDNITVSQPADELSPRRAKALKGTDLDDPGPNNALELVRLYAGQILGTERYSECNRDQRETRAALRAAKSFILQERQDRNWLWAKVFRNIYASHAKLNIRSGLYELGGEAYTLNGLIYKLECLLDIPFKGGPKEVQRWVGNVGETFDPVSDYLKDLVEQQRYDPKTRQQQMVKWEPKPDDWAWWNSLAECYLGAGDELSQKMLSRWLIAAVARVVQPGCKVDNALVLVGRQGARKTTFFSVLGGAWFTTLHGHQSTNDTVRLMQSAWVAEMGEIGGIIKKRDADHLKAFITETRDRLIKKYQEDETVLPRRTVFAGTTNDDAFLKDATGSRRFWLIELGHRTIPTELVQQERDRIWQMAMFLYNQGYKWYSDELMQAASELRNREFAVSSPVQDCLEDALSLLETTKEPGTSLLIKPTVALKAVGLSVDSDVSTKKIAEAMKALGYSRARVRLRGQRVSGYVPDEVDRGSAQWAVVTERDLTRAISPI